MSSSAKAEVVGVGELLDAADLLGVLPNSGLNSKKLKSTTRAGEASCVAAARRLAAG